MRALILFFCVMLFGCEKEPLQFFPQDHYYEMSQEEKEDDKNYYFHDDAVVVISPPDNNLEFIKAVDRYIDEHYDLNEIHKYTYFTIGFLKESSDTKRIYQDWDEYAEYINDPNNFGPTPRFNPEDILLLVSWSKRGYYQKKTNLSSCTLFVMRMIKKGAVVLLFFINPKTKKRRNSNNANPLLKVAINHASSHSVFLCHFIWL